jgi:hypothetical protein
MKGRDHNNGGVTTMNRTELRRLTRERVLDAKALLANRRWSGAYYLVGYALECALKSCILALVERTGVIFEDKKYAERCWTHNLEDLVQHAGLEDELEAALKSDPELLTFWGYAKDWNESSRYTRTPKARAVRLYKAITDAKHGVLPWIKSRW